MQSMFVARTAWGGARTTRLGARLVSKGSGKGSERAAKGAVEGQRKGGERAAKAR